MSLIHFFPTRTIFFSIGPIEIHWYGILYAIGFILGYYIVQKLQKYRNVYLTKEDWSNIATAVILGVLIGGRLGYVLLYDPEYYLMHPLKVIAVWEGGMSSHGGFIGVCISLIISRSYKFMPLFVLLDILIVPIAIGLALGRVGNFINQELYGIVTTLPWGISIPGVEGLRHPTQLYAVCKDLYLATTSYLILRAYYSQNKPGLVTGVFLVQYSILRFLIEFLRVPSHSLLYIGVYTITRGQLWSIPLCIAGVICIYISLHLKVYKGLTV